MHEKILFSIIKTIKKGNVKVVHKIRECTYKNAYLIRATAIKKL